MTTSGGSPTNGLPLSRPLAVEPSATHLAGRPADDVGHETEYTDAPKPGGFHLARAPMPGLAVWRVGPA